MTDLERAIQVIEHGLLKPTAERADPPERMDLLERMAHYKVPGISLALVDRGELAWARGYGLVEAGTDRPVTPGTIFQAGSISKPVSAMVALHLVEDGLLDLETDVNESLRSWQVPESKHTRLRRTGERPVVTLRGLLSHTAGFTIRGYRGHLADQPLPTLLQVLNGEKPANSRPVRVVQKPGKGFKYSGGGYLVMQQLVEDVSGRSLVDLAQELVFDPLAMAGSTFNHLLPDEYLARAATAHNRKGKLVPGKWHLYPEQAAGGLWSTPSDLARLVVEVIRSDRSESSLVLSTGMTHQMLTPQADIGGLGFLVIQSDGGRRFEHPGWNEGYHSLLIGDPAAGRGLVWMTNGENGRELGWELTRALAEVFNWSW